MKTLENLSVILPTYNEDDKALNKIVGKLRKRGAEVIVVDDGSDPPIRESIVSVRHSTNLGYGQALKSGVRHAKNDVVCFMDSDGQHKLEDVENLYAVFNMLDDCSLVIGCRWNLSESLTRRWGRKCLNFLGSCLAGHYLVDLNSGLRVLRRDLAIGYEPILCNTFSYTTSLTMSMVTDNHKIVWLPIDVQPRNFGSSRVRVIKDGITTLRYILVIGLAIRTRGIRKWLRSIRGQ